ncbi:hypothetical protein DFJ77DRAFT_198265 [Powellomyces hirtus]|nr:hypothetical protein DFJ77DRAFT_198265 [Powellomyces hirtus]
MGCTSSKQPSASTGKVVPEDTLGQPSAKSTAAAADSPTTAQPVAQPPPAVTTTGKPTTPQSSADRIRSAEQLPLGSRSSLDKAPMPPIVSKTSSSITNIASGTSSTTAISKKPASPPSANKNSATSVDDSIPAYSKAAEGPSKPIAFEIPLGETLFTAPEPAALTSAAAAKLPSLKGLTSEAIAAKLANADKRWKDLDDHEIQRKKSTRRRRAAGSKPELSSSSRPKTRAGRGGEDGSSSTSNNLTAEEEQEQLRIRLQKKEALAERNRKKELEKLAAKLQRMDQHVRTVQERKRVLERGDSEDDFAISVSGSTQSLIV